MNEKKALQIADAPLAGALEWIDRYAAAVAEQLPPKRRADIQLEVRSLLLDEVEQIAGDAAPTEAEVMQMLGRYPSPEEMAQRYGAATALIGPALYPGYVQVLKIVVTVVFWLAVIGKIFDAAIAPGMFAPLQTIGSIIGAIFASAGIVTLIFAIVERQWQGSNEAPKQGGASWTVRDLPPVVDPSRVSWTDSFTSIVTSLVSVLFLAYIYGRDGAFPIVIHGEWDYYPVLSETFVAALPWLIVLWSIELIVYIAVLARRRWTTPLRLIPLATGLLGLGILLWLLATVQLTVIPWAEWIARAIVIAMAIITAIECVGQVRGIIKSRRAKVTTNAISVTQTALK